MSWKLTFSLKEGDALLPIRQQQSLYSSFEKIVTTLGAIALNTEDIFSRTMIPQKPKS